MLKKDPAKFQNFLGAQQEIKNSLNFFEAMETKGKTDLDKMGQKLNEALKIFQKQNAKLEHFANMETKIEDLKRKITLHFIYCN